MDSDMEKQMFKTALRIWFRMIFWLARLIVSPLVLTVFLSCILYDAILFLYYWANENQNKIEYHSRGLRDDWTEIKKWISY